MGYHSLTTTTHPLNFNLPSSWQQSTTRLPARKVSVGWGNRAQDPLVRDATRVKHPSHNSGYGARLTSEPFWTWWQSDNPGRTTNRPRTIIRLRYYSSVTGTQKQYMIYLLTAIGLSASGSITVHIYTQTIHRTTQITTEQHKKQLIWKSAGRAPSLRILPRHLPYNWGKSTEKPQSGYSIHITKTRIHYKTYTRTHTRARPHCILIVLACDVANWTEPFALVVTVMNCRALTRIDLLIAWRTPER